MVDSHGITEAVDLVEDSRGSWWHERRQVVKL